MAAKVLGYILIASITATLTILAYNTSSDGAWLIVPLIVFYISYRLHKAIISWLRRRILSNHLQTKKKKKEKEDRKRKEEWEEYKKQRDQRDFERIEKYRMERERQEKRMRRKNNKITW